MPTNYEKPATNTAATDKGIVMPSAKPLKGLGETGTVKYRESKPYRIIKEVKITNEQQE